MLVEILENWYTGLSGRIFVPTQYRRFPNSALYGGSPLRLAFELRCCDFDCLLALANVSLACSFAFVLPWLFWQLIATFLTRFSGFRRQPVDRVEFNRRVSVRHPKMKTHCSGQVPLSWCFSPMFTEILQRDGWTLLSHQACFKSNFLPLVPQRPRVVDVIVDFFALFLVGILNAQVRVAFFFPY